MNLRKMTRRMLSVCDRCSRLKVRSDQGSVADEQRKVNLLTLALFLAHAFVVYRTLRPDHPSVSTWSGATDLCSGTTQDEPPDAIRLGLLCFIRAS